ncbi:aspartic peptidase A1 [Mycena belliarum]|uniref:Aspartic peptidase A1 n=1 Tax=Mycena belliarum TaxID=1033014 RepID=A0AAD6U5S6_9AGAR|nr:aspartic peptidase A1 [Mycena belliae]
MRALSSTCLRSSISYHSSAVLLHLTDDIAFRPQPFNVILDTGSSDLWVADTSCTRCSRETPLFNPSASTSFQTSSATTTISYGSGQVAGIVASDKVSMGNFSLAKQGFLAVDRTSANLLSGSVSGIMGLAFGAISSTRSVPFWQGLIADRQLSAPEMSFWLTRFRGKRGVREEEPGGAFTLGGRNASLFQGDIEFIDAGQASFWLLGLSGVTAQGNNVKVATGNAAPSAIDTGTTLIGGPTPDVNAIWAQVPGASLIGDSMPGFFQFPCSTTVQINMAFGGKSWPINPADMNLGPGTGGTMCLGGIFDLSLGSNIQANSGNPTWVVGDTFLKNVYTVFRQSPLSIGFAQLSDAAGGSGTPGAATTRPNGASPSGSGSGSMLLGLALGAAVYALL